MRLRQYIIRARLETSRIRQSHLHGTGQAADLFDVAYPREQALEKNIRRRRSAGSSTDPRQGWSYQNSKIDLPKPRRIEKNAQNARDQQSKCKDPASRCRRPDMAASSNLFNRLTSGPLPLCSASTMGCHDAFDAVPSRNPRAASPFRQVPFVAIASVLPSKMKDPPLTSSC
jgi:hypothetical protein